MQVTSLKYDLLTALYEAYKKDPLTAVDVTPIMHEHGVFAVTSMLEYGRALKSAGLLKDCSSNIDSFEACISIQGINQVSSDIKNEVYQLLHGLKADPHHYYPVKNHLEFLPKHYQCAIDLGHYLNSNVLAQTRVEDDDVFIRITERGLHFVSEPLDPSETSIRLIA